MRKPAQDTRAAINGVDLPAFRRQSKAFNAQTVARLEKLEKAARECDGAFETACAELRSALDAFNVECANFVEFQSGSLED